MSGQGWKKGAGETARAWWETLQPGKAEAGGSRGDRAALARLRRASSWIEAAAEPQTIVLFNQLEKKSEHSPKIERVAVLASVLAHVREDDKQNRSVAGVIGAPPDKGDEALLKPLRLRRLLAAKDEEAILTAFRRLVAIMGGKANVADLAWNILTWDSERTRMKFAFDYWRGPAPGAETDAAPAA